MHGVSGLKPGQIFGSRSGGSEPGVSGLRNLFCTLSDPLAPTDRYNANSTINSPAEGAPNSPILMAASGVLPPLNAALRKLDARIQRAGNEFWKNDRLPDVGGLRASADWENPSIPSGYTYLLQFIAHDTVHSAVACPIRGNLRTGIENLRRRPLMLDTLYGGGPGVDLAIYEYGSEHRNSQGKIPRTRLRVGLPSRPTTASVTSDCPFRDIARGRATHAQDEGSSPAYAKDWLTEAMVADVRNDSHALISQLTVLFHLLHNQLASIIEKQPIAIATGPEAVYHQFLCARTAVTLIYRNIIETDLLNLILHPRIYERYMRAGAELLDPTAGIPLEFSHAAFRFGHSMAREKYRINSDEPRSLSRALTFSAGRSPGALPVPADWMVDWARFFSTGTVDPNLSRRIGPDYAEPLRDTALLGDRETSDHWTALPGRDLMGACFAGIWSVPKLYAKLQGLLAGEPSASLLPPFEQWRRLMADWLAKSDPTNMTEPFTAAEIAAISNDPPMPFFVMFEAAHVIKAGAPAVGGGGQFLGPFGSIIVAEALFGALRFNPLGVENAGPTLSARLAACCDGLLGNSSALRQVPEISSMSALLKFMASSGAFAASS